MILKCQENSFLTEFTATVQKCEQAEYNITVKGKSVKKKGYAVILDDTIIFPEGGGQPSDEGEIGGVQVVSMERSGGEVRHYTQQPLENGVTLPLTINWKRRFDHMQQHSGQHLLSAILEKEYKLNTTAWWLGEVESYVELSANSVSKEILDAVEERCNHLIRQALPVTVTVCEKDDPNLDKAHTRGLPADHVGPVRIISIKDVDDNLCCGTHVSNLSQLQVIKILGAEPGKKNKTNVRFLVGDRVIGRLQLALDREQTLTKILNNDASQHADLVEKLQTNVKVLKKGEGALLEELCTLLVSRTYGEPLIIHRDPPIPSSFPQTLARIIPTATSPPSVSLITHGDPQGAGGSLMLLAPQDVIKDLSPKICEMLKGKGGGTGGRFQAKVGDLSKIKECQEMVRDYIEEKRRKKMEGQEIAFC